MNENEQKEQTTQTTLATAAEAIDVSSLAAPAPAQSPTGGADPRDEEIAELKHRLEVESAEQGRLRKANDELRKLQDENARLKAENAKLSVRSPGDYLTDEERAKMTELLSAGFSDTFRVLYPDRTDAYSWWSYMFHAREKNVGWRIDYFLCSNRFCERLEDSLIYPQYLGSDHCPVAIITKE